MARKKAGPMEAPDKCTFCGADEPVAFSDRDEAWCVVCVTKEMKSWNKEIGG